MIYAQREPEPDSDSLASPGVGRPWRPPDSAASDLEGDRERDPTLTDAVLAAAHYVAVDRIDGAVVTLAVAAWPVVEPATGRLDFGPPAERRPITVDAARLQTRIDVDRTAAGQLVRPIRVGDVFLVIDLGGPLPSWGRIVDLTRAGRLAAKAALYSAVAPAPTLDEAAALGLDPARIAPQPTGDAGPGKAGGEEPPPAGPVAYPAV